LSSRLQGQASCSPATEICQPARRKQYQVPIDANRPSPKPKAEPPKRGLYDVIKDPVMKGRNPVSDAMNRKK